MRTTIEKIFQECEEAMDGANAISNWVKNKQWINESDVVYCIANPKTIRFNSSSRKVLAFHLGADGWELDHMSTIKKIVDGIEIQCEYHDIQQTTISI